jgi:FtsX-like permease family
LKPAPQQQFVDQHSAADDDVHAPADDGAHRPRGIRSRQLRAAEAHDAVHCLRQRSAVRCHHLAQRVCDLKERRGLVIGQRIPELRWFRATFECFQQPQLFRREVARFRHQRDAIVDLEYLDDRIELDAKLGTRRYKTLRLYIDRVQIGVVRDIPLSLRHTAATPVIYTSYLQQPGTVLQEMVGLFGRMHFMVRTAGDPLGALAAVRKAVATIDADRPLASVETMDQLLEGNVPQLGNMVLVLAGFALTAVLLAALGIYGVVAYAAARRTREIGIRIALGASRREIVALVSRRALVFVTAGLAIGLAAALAVTRLLESQLWDVSPTDPATFVGMVVLLVVVAAAACFVPTRRAVTLNPTLALRE